MPQKKFLGNLISDEVSNGMLWELESGAEFAVRVAFDETLQPENKLDGSAASALAARAERANSRRVRPKVEAGSSRNDTAAID